MKRSNHLYFAAKILDQNIFWPIHLTVFQIYNLILVPLAHHQLRKEISQSLRIQIRRTSNFHFLLDPLDLILIVDELGEQTLSKIQGSIKSLRRKIPVLGQIEIYTSAEFSEISQLKESNQRNYELLRDARSIRWQEEACASADTQYHKYKAIRAIENTLKKYSIAKNKASTNNWRFIWPYLIELMEAQDPRWKLVPIDINAANLGEEAYSAYFQILFDWSGTPKPRNSKADRDAFSCSIHQALFFLALAPGEPISSPALREALAVIREKLKLHPLRNSLAEIEILSCQALTRSTLSKDSSAATWLEELKQSNDSKRTKQITCMRPWYSLFIYRDVKVCCWQKTNIGELKDDSNYRDFWNGEKAQEIRRDMYNSAYGEVPEKHCPTYCNGKISSDDFIEEYSTAAIDGQFSIDLVPHEISAIVDHLCNLRCKMCWIFDDPAYLISLAGYRNMIKEIDDSKNRYNPAVTFIGGEPFFSKNSRALIQEIIENRKSIRLSFISNMLVWDEVLLNKIEVNRIGAWTVSFDGGTKQTYEMIRKNSNFEKVLGNIKKLCEYRLQRSKDLNEGYWNILVPSIVMTSNFSEIDYTFYLFKNFPVEINFVPIAREYRGNSYEQIFATTPQQEALLEKLVKTKELIATRLQTVDEWNYEILINHHFSASENQKMKIELTQRALNSIDATISYLKHIMKHEQNNSFQTATYDYEVSTKGKVLRKELATNLIEEL